MTVRTRLAPTPSGALHVGNAFSFLLAWLWARHQGGKVVLRIEDVDTTRSRPDWIEAVFRDLEWLGLDWEEGPQGPSDAQSPFRQSSPLRQERYQTIWREWSASGQLYPCRCTRSDLRTDAPQIQQIGEAQDFGIPYVGRCRHRTFSDAAPSDAWRLRLDDDPSTIDDLWMGRHELSRLSQIGDPVLRRGDGCTAYHLAVCLDDFDQGITHVVRGRDLLGFTHLHVYLHKLMNNFCPPKFLHHGLLGDHQGLRLAKRIGSESLTGMRCQGMDSRLLVAKLAKRLYPQALAGSIRCTPHELLTLGSPLPLTGDQTWIPLALESL